MNKLANALEKMNVNDLKSVLNNPASKTLSTIDKINSKTLVVVSAYETYRSSDAFGALLNVLANTLGNKVPGVGEFLQVYSQAYVNIYQAAGEIKYINNSSQYKAISMILSDNEACPDCDYWGLILNTGGNNECRSLLK